MIDTANSGTESTYGIDHSIAVFALTLEPSSSEKEGQEGAEPGMRWLPREMGRPAVIDDLIALPLTATALLASIVFCFLRNRFEYFSDGVKHLCSNNKCRWCLRGMMLSAASSARGFDKYSPLMLVIQRS